MSVIIITLAGLAAIAGIILAGGSDEGERIPVRIDNRDRGRRARRD